MKNCSKTNSSSSSSQIYNYQKLQNQITITNDLSKEEIERGHPSAGGEGGGGMPAGRQSQFRWSSIEEVD